MKVVKMKNEKQKTQQDKLIAQKKTYNSIVSYLFALTANNQLSSSFGRVTIFLLQLVVAHNQLSFHSSRRSFYNSFLWLQPQVPL